jgi:hypothetical protein
MQLIIETAQRDDAPADQWTDLHEVSHVDNAIDRCGVVPVPR